MGNVARRQGTYDGHNTGDLMSFPVASGVTVNAGDFVKFDGSGKLTTASINSGRILGVAQETQTGNAGGTIKAMVEVHPMAQYLIKGNATQPATNVGCYFNLTGSAGSQTVDVSSKSTSTGQLVLLEGNPQVDPVRTDLTYGRYGLFQGAFNN